MPSLSSAATDTHDAFALQISRVSRAWRARLDERLRHTGLTQARWSALLLLARGAKGMTQRALAGQLGVEGPTVGRLLDALERQGLVERRAVKGDRRAYHIHLTSAARPVLKEINAIAAGLRRDLLEGVSTRRLAQCQAVLAEVAERLEKRR